MDMMGMGMGDESSKKILRSWDWLKGYNFQSFFPTLPFYPFFS
jgi:hypothetical protein